MRIDNWNEYDAFIKAWLAYKAASDSFKAAWRAWYKNAFTANEDPRLYDQMQRAKNEEAGARDRFYKCADAYAASLGMQTELHKD